MDLPAGTVTDHVRRLATDVATALGAEARASTTPGIERATLRLLGVGGLDHAGRPLAASVVDRAIGDDPGRLARGVLLPFIAAAQLYDASPMQVALDVAAGTIDLDLEADALADPMRRDAVHDLARELVTAALARIEANRTARTELLHLLGEAPEPLLCVPVRAGLLDQARPEAVALVGGGADQVLIDVPAARELIDRLADPRETADDALRIAREPRTEGEVPPAGSQRALAEIRAAVDDVAAEQRRYARIAAVTRALGAPEAAIVAGFERLDAVRADPITEIVDGVDPARALADHAFARRILLRAGCRIEIDPGPLVVAPDLAAGAPSSAVVRAGRAIALQSLSVELARADGVPDQAIRVGTLPEWLLGERVAGSIGLATIVAQRRLFRGLGIGFIEPSTAGEVRDRWWQIRTLGEIVAGGAASMVRQVDVAQVGAAAAENRTAAETVARLVSDAGVSGLGPRIDEVAAAVLASAAETLRTLADEGWDPLLDAVPGSRSRIASSTTSRRSSAPDVTSIGMPPGP